MNDRANVTVWACVSFLKTYEKNISNSATHSRLSWNLAG